MKKYVVIGINDNPKYSYYLPLVVLAWRFFGWDTVIFYCGQKTAHNNFIYATLDMLNDMMTPQQRAYFRLMIIGADSLDGHKSETIAQVSRLYAACAMAEDRYLMTTDADMLPLSNYWRVESKALFTDRNGTGKHMMPPKATAWGRDLTDYHYPICYLGATSKDWVQIMQLQQMNHNAMIKRDLETIKPRTSVWTLDQDIVTQRILEYGKDKIVHVNRGTDQNTGYPLGRVDRSNWHLNHLQFVDAHLPHDTLTNDESFKKVLNLLHHVWPQANWNWFVAYHKEFKKLI